MDLGLPIRSVIPSLDAVVYRVLVRAGSPLTAPQVQRIAGEGSVDGIRVVLNRMVDEGLAVSNRAGNAFLYEINREHLAFDAIAALVNLAEHLLRNIRSHLDPIADHLAGAYVFGSVARGDADRESDIDVLIVLKGAVSSEDRAAVEECTSDLSHRLIAWTGNPGRVILSDTSELGGLAIDERPIIDALRADAQVITGPPFDQLLAGLPERS